MLAGGRRTPWKRLVFQRLSRMALQHAIQSGAPDLRPRAGGGQANAARDAHPARAPVIPLFVRLSREADSHAEASVNERHGWPLNPRSAGLTGAVGCSRERPHPPLAPSPASQGKEDGASIARRQLSLPRPGMHAAGLTLAKSASIRVTRPFLRRALRAGHGSLRHPARAVGTFPASQVKEQHAAMMSAIASPACGGSCPEG
jgi:hypothetical protein